MLAVAACLLIVATPEIWVGHQVAVGRQHLPIFGSVESQTDSYLIAHIEHENGVLSVQQKACAVRFSKVLGVSLSFPKSTLQALPKAHFRFVADTRGAYRADPWEVAWADDDLDHDGNPGITLKTQSLMCSGNIYIATSTVTSGELTAASQAAHGTLEGYLSLHVKQEVLGSTSACLRLGPDKKELWQLGAVRYRRVEAEATCDSFEVPAWPVKVQDAVIAELLEQL